MSDKINDRAAAKDLKGESASMAGLLMWVSWLAAAYIFLDAAYVPLKGVGAALMTPGADMFAAVRGVLMAMAGVIHVFALLGAAWSARGLFRRFAAGEVFTGANGAALGRVGDWLIGSAFLSATVAIHFDEVRGAAVNGVSWPAALALGIVGLAIRLLGRAFGAAAALKAENEQFI